MKTKSVVIVGGGASGALRREIAQANNIPPCIVFSDKRLKELSISLPKNREGMLEVHGIGEVKYERYGEKFIRFIGEIGA